MKVHVPAPLTQLKPTVDEFITAYLEEKSGNPGPMAAILARYKKKAKLLHVPNSNNTR